jgi:hypothetical protein
MAHVFTIFCVYKHAFYPKIMTARKLLPYIEYKLKPGFAVGLFGARRTGQIPEGGFISPKP